MVTLHLCLSRIEALFTLVFKKHIFVMCIPPPPRVWNTHRAFDSSTQPDHSILETLQHCSLSYRYKSVYLWKSASIGLFWRSIRINTFATYTCTVSIASRKYTARRCTRSFHAPISTTWQCCSTVIDQLATQGWTLLKATRPHLTELWDSFTEMARISSASARTL